MQEAPLDSDRIWILTAEYQASKASAETHLSLIWQATNIMWAANMVLIGFVVNALDKPATLKLVPALAIFAILTLIASTQFTSYYRTVALHEYNRCKEIEDELRMKRTSIDFHNTKQKITLRLSVHDRHTYLCLVIHFD